MLSVPNIVLLILLWSVPALTDGPYVSVSGGVSFLESHHFHEADFHYKKGLSLAAAVGWDFGIPRL